MKTKFIFFILVFNLLLSQKLLAQDVTIPDSIFKSSLISNVLINTNLDTEIQVAEALAFTGGIYVGGLGISDLTGIEAFINLSYLNVNNNFLTSLDLTNNNRLIQINCYFNQLDTLKLTSDTLLTYLECSYNNLRGIDVSGFPELQNLYCYNNQITNLDVSQNFLLVNLNCSSNSLQLLNLQSNLSLSYLDCSFNLITSLDFSALGAIYSVTCNNNALSNIIFSPSNTNLSEIFCYNNQLANLTINGAITLYQLNCSNNLLSSLDLTGITQVNYLDCSNNQINSLQLPVFYNLNCNSNALTSLNFSANTSLTTLTCASNNLSDLNIQNGNNFNLYDFDATDNPLLTCVQVDDTSYMNLNWPFAIDTTAIYKLTCTNCIVNIPDTNFKTALVSNLAINLNGNAEIECSEALAYTGTINVAAAAISDLSGIEYFTSLTILNCANNLIPNLDLSANTQLVELNCSVNQLTSISLVNNTLLQTLYTAYNPITTLDLSANPLLSTVICNNSQLSNLNISSATNLVGLNCSTNQLSTLDVANNANLVELNCDENMLTALDVAANNQLTTLTCSYNQLSNLDISGNALVINLNCKNNQLTNLNIQNGADSLLTAFDAKQNPQLTCIQVDDTNFMNTNWSAAKDAIASYSLQCGCLFPSAAGTIAGAQQVGACFNQLNINYSISPIANATNYVWSLPPLATFVGIADSNSITVNYSAYSSSGTVSVYGTNTCGNGSISSLPISFKAIPEVQICYATVDSATQDVEIFWQKPIETYINGYIIYRETASGSGNYLTVDTVNNTLFSSYLDTGSHPELQSEKYKIAVLDSCGNTGDTSAIFEHQTIRLYGSVQPGGVAKLYWNDYVGINDPSRYFKLLRDTLGTGPFNDTLASNISPAPYMNSSDPQSASYPLARYVVEMVYNSNCTPSARLLLNKSTSRSNIKNKTALFDSSSVGINQIHFNFDGIKVYPNPAKEKLLISNLNQNFTYEIELINSIGECVQRTIISSSPIKELNLRDYPSGLYFITIKSRTDQISYKIQIE